MFDTLTVYLVAIVVLLYAYVYVWSRGPQDGKLWRMIRRLRKAERYWRKRALRDEAILSRVIDKRNLVLGVFLCLFLIPVVNFDTSAIPAAIGNESQEVMFSTASDGDVSSESIGEDYSHKFRETLPDDDVLFYPDSFFNGTVFVANTGNYSSTQIYTYINTQNDDTASWFVYDDTSPYDAYAILNFTIPTFDYTIDSIRITTDTIAKDYNLIDFIYYNISVYNHGTSAWDLQYTDINDTEFTTRYTTLGDVGYFSDTVLVKIHSTNYTSLGPILTWEYSCVEYGYMTFADSDHYAESFADVSDWTEYSCEIAATLSSDGDVLSFETESSTDNNYNGYYSDITTFDAQGKYMEICAKVNSTANYDMSQIRLVNSNDGAGPDFYYKVFYLTTDWQTFKYPVDSFTKNGNGDLSAVESIMIIHRIDSAAGTEVQSDYLRIGPSTEMGFSHDGSTTAGVTDDGDAGVTYTVSSDDDILTMNATKAPGAAAGYVEFHIAIDTTATSADIEDDYYPFFGIRVHVASDLADVKILPIWDGRYFSETITRGSWQTLRFNHRAATGSSGSKMLRFDAYLVESQSVEWKMDWGKAYSIANFSNIIGHDSVNKYLYVDNGVLYSTDDYMELLHDPTLAVSTNTYNVVNITTGSGDDVRINFYYGGGVWEGYKANGETRWGLTSDKTVADFNMRFYAAGYISAIKFIEDGTAPLIVRSSANPPDPSDDEGVVLKAVVDDAVEVHTVKFNAIVYPDGFSDVDYSATEQTDNLWMYSFSSLDAGNYTFKVIASDGANENDLTEYAYIDFVVREAEIQLDPINQEGAEPDATHYQVSFVCNKAGDWSVTEWTESDGSDAAETHTGVVVEGWNNIAWEKLDTDSSVVYFNMTVTSNTLTRTVPGLYLVAQTTFYVDAGQVEGIDTVTVSGRISKLGAWQLYDDLDTLKDTGSITDLDFTVRFTKWSGYDEQDHDFSIKFTNGSQSCWYNSSYYAFKKPVVAPVPTTDENALYAFQVSFWTLIAVLAVGGMVIVQGKERYGK